ncbi:MAG: sialate O-acetylesterase [Planctomycetes bacterium]|nr:sialate O-acetylesterase [Planctomycetota bacterium]
MIRPLALACAAAVALAAEPLPLLHPLFADHMVFPRERAAPVWGWAAPGARLTLTLAGARAEAVAGADGRWQAALGPIPAGGPHQLVVDGPARVVCQDVLVGDVWLFSGQSNMEMGLGGAEGGAQEIAGAAAAAGNLRLLHLGHRAAGTPRAVPAGDPLAWALPAPHTTGGFSAVAWFTGRTLAAELKIPVGLVSCAWAGSNIRGWMPAASLERLGLYADELAALRPLAAVEAGGGASVQAQERARVQAWWAANDPGTAAGWMQPGAALPVAQDLAVPGRWSAGGVAWLVRDVELPAAAAGLGGWLRLGAIADEETTYVNGVPVGETAGWTLPRPYPLPAGSLRAGVNRIAIRILARAGQGQALGAAGDWRLEPAGQAAVPLDGTWRLAQAATAAALPAKPPLVFQGGPVSPTLLWNGGIAPLAPFAFAGAVWYQGEQDSGSPDYQRLLTALIAEWRARFAAPRLPVVVVQLPAFGAAVPAPVQEPLWFGAVREAQAAVAREVPAVGLAVTTDLGDAGDVHPRRKREVGERAAHAALGVAYGREDAGGPLFAAAERAGAAMRVRFTRVHGRLEVRAGGPSGFAVRGADGAWHHAQARVAGDALLVEAPAVAAPVAVRYGWAENPPVTLYDQAGMPASPFRSDR